MINTTKLREYVTKHFQHVPDHDFHFNAVCRPIAPYIHPNAPNRDTRYGTNTCGTVGCVCGWLPLMFPEVTQNLQEDCLVYDGHTWAYADLGAHLLDLPHYVADDLFTPNCQNHLHPALDDCDSASTVKQVSEMLLHFCDLADADRIHQFGRCR